MPSTLGGPVPTPNLDRLAKGGLTYNRFHTTALCSPTRAALLTGRNHHSAGTGIIIEQGTGYPGYTGIIPKSTGLVSRMLRDNGYATAVFGKWHNTPEVDITPAGPFNRWPTGLGFDYYYGFNQGANNQYYPTIYRNTTWVPQPKSPEQGYHFAADMTDESIAWIRNSRAAAPDKPWFVYYSAAGVHSPHHAPKDWRDKFVGKFDHGWDKQRELTFAKQLELGVIPQGTKLTPRPKDIPAWDDQTPEARKVYARLMENYAAYMAYTDAQVGRLIESLRASGELDNTLIMYIVGDNGASVEGGLEGTVEESAVFAGIVSGLDKMGSRIDDIGGPSTEPHVPVAWAWAMNTPFQWAKQFASHFGGTRNPMVIHWPNGIKAKGELRQQFHHVIDVVPTILEATKIPAPKAIDGIAQKPIEGVSMVYTFENAKAEDRRTTQYFEILTNRAIYDKGWVAASYYALPWKTAIRDEGFLNAPWELYNIDKDFSQANDLAATNPEKLAQMKAKFVDEAKKHDVFPLDGRWVERYNPALRVAGEPQTKWTYFGNNLMVPDAVGPVIFPQHHTITAELLVPEAGVEGVIAATGGITAGWSLYVKGGKPVFQYSLFGEGNATISGTQALPAGKVILKTEFTPDGSRIGGGTLKMLVNGAQVAEGKLPRTYFRHGNEPFELGRDSISPVSPVYKSPNAFTGQIERVTFEQIKK